jgi:hypothetical protein
VIASSRPIPREPKDADGHVAGSDRPTAAPPFDIHVLAGGSREASDDADAPESDRPTVVPPFDPEAFAQDSEIRQRVSLPLAEETTIDKARRLLQGGDAEQALFLVERLLEQIPLDTDARTLANECRAALEREYLAVIGSAATVFIVDVTPNELKTMALDHVSGFLLTLTDGVTNVETLLDLCGLPQLVALRHLRDLVRQGIIVDEGRA